MASELEDFHEVVGAIYEAALERALWDEALVRFVNTYSPPHWDVSFLLWESPPHIGARFVAAANVVAHAREIYATRFAGVNPWSLASRGLPLGAVVDTREICAPAMLERTEFFRNFLSVWSLTHAFLVLLDKDEGANLAWVMPGPDGQDTRRLRRAVRLVAPHIQRAVRISRRLAEADLRAAGAEASLAATPAGMVCLRQDLSIVNINPRATALAGQGVARIAQGRWRFATPAAQAEVERLADAPQASSCAFIARDQAGEEHAVLALRIPTQRALALDGFIEGAAVLLTIGPKSKAPAIPEDHLASWFGLTPSEAKLAAALVSGETLKAFAVRRGVSENAVRFLMKGVLRKTDTKDQARLVAALRAMPLA